MPICALIERVMADGSEGLLMAADLQAALTEAARARSDGAWTATRISMGRELVLDGEALEQAIGEAAGLPA